MQFHFVTQKETSKPISSNCETKKCSFYKPTQELTCESTSEPSTYAI